MLAVVAISIIIGEQIAGVSADAVINAQVLILRAPIDGDVKLAVRKLGTRVKAGEPLASINDQRPDDTRIIDLQRDVQKMLIDLVREKALVVALEAVREIYARQAEAYSTGRIKQLEARLSEAQAAIEGLQSRLRDTEAAFQRATDLARNGYQSIAEVSRTRATFEVVAQEVQAARQRITYLSIELDAARKGTFLGDSFNDMSYSEQRQHDAEQRLGDLAIGIRDRNERLGALNDQISAERVRQARYLEARIVAPTDGILWELMSGGGEYVRKAQDVMRVVDCTTTVVTASVRESLYNRISLGDPVQVRLLGDARLYDGTVARLAGSGAETVYRSPAIGPSLEHLKRFDVLISSTSLAEDPNLACAVGRTGKVVFSARPLDFWRQFLAEIGLR
ncbi:MAG: HlyD family efflux transporter periplasmic adaptor subunit [Acetobacteraceae bacterium]|nr:HlyD family efflux transporter periplasmic adaptor subunit [Acetobacteraceae bacterium]